jgi:O-succinylbenzoic acid--CoA ligase
VVELVALDLDPGPALVEALEAVWERGDAACVLDRRLGARAAAHELATLRPTRRRGPDGTEAAIDGGEPVAEGDALVVRTSGSTAVPRAVVLTHAAVAASARATSARLGVDPSSDRWLCCLPCAHVGGLAVVTRALLTGTPLVVHDRFDAERASLAAREGATLVSLVPTALGRLDDPGAFRTILLGGAAPPEDRPDNAVVTWGMTETGSGVVYDGVPLDTVEVAESDGELFVRGPMLARAYRDGTTTTGRGPDGTNGWLATGDGGTVRDGVVTVRGRIADVINTGGEKVWPGDVERTLSGHRGVQAVAVWRRPDPEWGERVVAWVVPRDPAPTLDELCALAAGSLPAWSAPKELVLVESLPMTPSGKVDRRQLT